MIARLALTAGAIAYRCHTDSSGAVFRRYRAHLALQRCNRLLARSDAAREAGDRKAADRCMKLAISAMQQSERIGGGA